jgi:transcriptional regulator with XRE-family HTH domain
LRLERLKKARTEAGMTEHELSRKSGVSQEEISRIEKGMETSDYAAMLLSRALGVEPRQLMGPVGPASVNVEPEEVEPSYEYGRVPPLFWVGDFRREEPLSASPAGRKALCFFSTLERAQGYAYHHLGDQPGVFGHGPLLEASGSEDPRVLLRTADWAAQRGCEGVGP